MWKKWKKWNKKWCIHPKKTSLALRERFFVLKNATYARTRTFSEKKLLSLQVENEKERKY